jgi:hypothetical protein
MQPDMDVIKVEPDCYSESGLASVQMGTELRPALPALKAEVKVRSGCT